VALRNSLVSCQALTVSTVNKIQIAGNKKIWQHLSKLQGTDTQLWGLPRTNRVFFYWSALKMTKCQTLRKFWHLELFRWDLLCNLTLSSFLGRTSNKTPCRTLPKGGKCVKRQYLELAGTIAESCYKPPTVKEKMAPNPHQYGQWQIFTCPEISPKMSLWLNHFSMLFFWSKYIEGKSCFPLLRALFGCWHE